MIFKNNLNLNGNLIIAGGIERLATAPANPKVAQMYVNSTSNVLMQYTGTEWKNLGAADAIKYKGTVGMGGTVTDLPTDASAVENGDLYLVCTKGSYGPTTPKQYAVIGDQFIANKPVGSSTFTWNYIPSGNDTFAQEITGDGTTTEWTINHALNTLDVHVQIYDTASGSTGDQIFTDVQHTDADNVKVIFASAPAATEKYKVVVLA